MEARKKQELAEEILEKAIVKFNDLNVDSVELIFNDLIKKIIISSNGTGLKECENLCYEKEIFDNIKTLLDNSQQIQENFNVEFTGQGDGGNCYKVMHSIILQLKR